MAISAGIFTEGDAGFLFDVGLLSSPDLTGVIFATAAVDGVDGAPDQGTSTFLRDADNVPDDPCEFLDADVGTGLTVRENLAAQAAGEIDGAVDVTSGNVRIRECEDDDSSSSSS